MTEADLHAAVVAAVNEMHAHQDAYLPQLKINIEKAIRKNNSGQVAELDGKIADLEQEILKRTRARQDCDDLGKEVIQLREEKYQLQLEDASKETLRQIEREQKRKAKRKAEALQLDKEAAVKRFEARRLQF